ncbi:unnamed protein product [Urochloa humidicola]
METFGGATFPERQAKRRLPMLGAAPWPRCYLSRWWRLLTPEVETRRHRGAANVYVAAPTSASALPPSSAHFALICRSMPYPSACETALTSSDARSARPRGGPVHGVCPVRHGASHQDAHLSVASASGMRDCTELLDISLAQLRDVSFR